MFIARHLRNCDVQYRTSTKKCSQKCGIHSQHPTIHCECDKKILIQSLGWDVLIMIDNKGGNIL